MIIGVKLADAAAWATIIGTIIVVPSAILAWRGMLSLRLPDGLVSLEARALFVLSIAVVALPIVAWGALAGLIPALLNLLILPWMPAYLQRWFDIPDRERAVELPQGLLFALAIGLVLMNVGALLSMVPWPSLPDTSSWFKSKPVVGSPDIRQRIEYADNCSSIEKEFQLALDNFRRAEARRERDRLIEEREYMRLASRESRERSCATALEVPDMPPYGRLDYHQ